jgi:nucleoid-associated protein YgaU
LQNLVIGIVLIVLALLVAAVFAFHQFGPDIGLTPPPELAIHEPDGGEDSTLQVTVGGGNPKAEELHDAAQHAISMDHAREIVEQQSGILTPSEKRTLDEKRTFQHVVKKGETLRGLAREYLNDERLWQAILDANKSLTRPEDLQEGQTILIPLKDAK